MAFLSLFAPSLTILVVSAALSWLIIVTVRYRLADRYLLDHPNNRSSHSQPTPRGGGIGIVLVSLGGMAFFLWQQESNLLAWSLVLLGGLLVATISGIDDVLSLPNSLRFATHLFAACMAVTAFGPLDAIGFGGDWVWKLGWLGWPLAVFWIVALTNVYNFMDGIDGLAGTQAVIASAGWVAVAFVVQDLSSLVFSLLIMGGCIGFLVHNWPPARIFMGDIGSTFLGYIFATLTLSLDHHTPALAIAGILPLWPFLFDATVTLIRRALEGFNIFEAHRSHIYQRLILSGLSHRFVTLLYGILSLFGLFTTLVLLQSQGRHWLSLMIMPLLALGLWYYATVRQRLYP